MSAYVTADVEITDANLYGQFLEQVTATVEAHGGKFVARGGEIEAYWEIGHQSASPYLNSTASSRPRLG